MVGAPRPPWRAVAGSAFGALVLLLSSPAHAATIACKGVLMFGDASARASTLFVEPESGRIRTPSCFKYPELAGFCAGHIRHAQDHRFVFGAVASTENSKIRAELFRESVSSTDGEGVERLKVLFVGRCEPIHTFTRHRPDS